MGSVEVHVQQGGAKQLDLESVGVSHIDRVAHTEVWTTVRNFTFVEAPPQRFELLRTHRNSDVLYSTQRLLKFWMFVPGKVEESEQVTVSNIKKDMGATDVVSILEYLDHWEAKKVLIKGNRRVYIRADKSSMMDAPRARRGERFGCTQVMLPSCESRFEVFNHYPNTTVFKGAL